MSGQTILRDFHPLRKSGRHHPPADPALQRTETEDQPKSSPQLRAQSAAPQEPEKRQQIGNSDRPPEQPVAPFPPENGLELRKTHGSVEFAIFRAGLVAFARLAPLLLIARPHRPA